MTIQFNSYQPYLCFGEFADIFLEETDRLAIRWEEGGVDSISSSHESGAGLRYLQGLETRYGHTDLAQPIEGIVTPEENARLGRIQKDLTQGLPHLLTMPLQPPIKQLHSIIKPPKDTPLDEKILLIKNIFEATNVGLHIRQVIINYGETQKRIGYLNSLGQSFYEERTYVTLSLEVTVERGKLRQRAYEAIGGLTGLELFSDHDAKQLGRQVAERAHHKLNAPFASAGPMPVVIAASAGGTLIHEAVGHSLEADAVLEGTSPVYHGRLGQAVANEKLTVMDDPTLVSFRGSFGFDDEGVPSSATKLIDNGVLKDYLYDRLSAKRAGRASNGHGRRESYKHRPIPRMSNTFIAPGTDDPQKIVDSLTQGLLVIKMGGGQVNTANGDFIFEVEEGYEVKDGQKHLVRGATLLGNGPEVLKTIDQVGSDHGWGVGTCGKEGQGVPVSDAMPTIRIPKVIVGGSQ